MITVRYPRARVIFVVKANVSINVSASVDVSVMVNVSARVMSMWKTKSTTGASFHLNVLSQGVHIQSTFRYHALLVRHGEFLRRLSVVVWVVWCGVVWCDVENKYKHCPVT